VGAEEKLIGEELDRIRRFYFYFLFLNGDSIVLTLFFLLSFYVFPTWKMKSKIGAFRRTVITFQRLSSPRLGHQAQLKPTKSPE
jgi:hypothetical protein